MARRRRRAPDASGVPEELRPDGWKAFLDPDDLARDDPVVAAARAHRRQSDALAEWAARLGFSWGEACRRVGRGQS